METPPVSTIFREQAFLHFMSQDEMQQSLKIVSIKSWMWVALSFIFLLAFCLWGMLGEMVMTVPAKGIIFPEKQILEIEKFRLQNVKYKNDKLVALKIFLDRKTALYNNHYLTAMELQKAKEDYSAAKLEMNDPNKIDYSPASNFLPALTVSHVNESLQALVFVGHEEGKKIKAGAEVYLLPGMISAFQYGYIKGKVLGVSEYPASKQVVFSYLGNMNLVDEFFAEGAPFMVKVQLLQSDNTISKLLWTTREGAPFTVEPGTSVSVEIVNKKCMPFQLLSKSSGCV